MESSLKNQLIAEIVWAATRQGAFQRAYIYNGKVGKEEKGDFQKYIKEYCYENLYQKKQHKFSERELKEIIIKLLKGVNSKFDSIQKGDGFKFGNAQKFVNLYLKSLWIIGEAEEPPHFPVDRVIQKGFGNIKSWTKMDENDYDEVIKKAKLKAKECGKSLANWEAERYFILNKNDIQV